MSNEPVGVLVIGAGASGAAFAWSIAGAGMRVLCLDQGPWMKQRDYPSNGLDWEERGLAGFATRPNGGGLAADYPCTDQRPDVSPPLFNAGGAKAKR